MQNCCTDSLSLSTVEVPSWYSSESQHSIDRKYRSEAEPMDGPLLIVFRVLSAQTSRWRSPSPRSMSRSWANRRCTHRRSIEDDRNVRSSLALIFTAADEPSATVTPSTRDFRCCRRSADAVLASQCRRQDIGVAGSRGASVIVPAFLRRLYRGRYAEQDPGPPPPLSVQVCTSLVHIL